MSPKLPFFDTPLEITYNPWHGCFRFSEGCKNCYVFTIDSLLQKNAKEIYKTRNFHLPIAKRRNGSYKIPSHSKIWLCFSSDFLLESADKWRLEVWQMIAERKDCTFIFFTKRIARFRECIPSDWGQGYSNVIVGCSVESQKEANARLPIFLESPIVKRWIICEPLLENINLTPFLDSSKIAEISVGGESGLNARVCNFAWVLSLQQQAKLAGITFHFRQTGANFIKDSKLYRIPKRLQRLQAQRAKVDWEAR